jgi:hypothetical protein
MSRKHLHLLETILQNPMACNLHWRDVEAMILHLGGIISPSHGARFKVVLNGHEFFLHHPAHGNEVQRLDIKHLRHELIAAGITLAEEPGLATSDGAAGSAPRDEHGASGHALVD